MDQSTSDSTSNPDALKNHIRIKARPWGPQIRALHYPAEVINSALKTRSSKQALDSWQRRIIASFHKPESPVCINLSVQWKVTCTLYQFIQNFKAFHIALPVIHLHFQNKCSVGGKSMSFNQVPVGFGNRRSSRFSNFDPQQTPTPENHPQHCYQNKCILQPHVRDHGIYCIRECKT